MTAIDTHRREILDILANPERADWPTYQLAMRLRLPTRRVLHMMKRLAYDGVVTQEQPRLGESDPVWNLTAQGRDEQVRVKGYLEGSA